MRNDSCKLCYKKSNLVISHVVPRSITKWLKNTAATPFLRGGKNPEMRVQDGLKLPLLCQECEQRLSPYEQYFMERIFLPINSAQLPYQGPDSFTYDYRLFYFLVSVWWRTIQWSLTDKELRESKYWKTILECEEELRSFLLTFCYPRDFDRIYINLLGYVEHAPDEYRRVNHFFMRSIDPFVMFTNSACFFSLRIPSFWFFANIVGLNDQELLPLRLIPSGGVFRVPRGRIFKEPNISGFMDVRLRAYSERFGSISRKQSEIIEADAFKNVQRLKSSKTLLAARLDHLRETGNRGP